MPQRHFLYFLLWSFFSFSLFSFVPSLFLFSQNQKKVENSPSEVEERDLFDDNTEPTLVPMKYPTQDASSQKIYLSSTKSSGLNRSWDKFTSIQEGTIAQMPKKSRVEEKSSNVKSPKEIAPSLVEKEKKIQNISPSQSVSPQERSETSSGAQKSQRVAVKLDQNGEWSLESASFLGADILISLANRFMQGWVSMTPSTYVKNGFIDLDAGKLEAQIVIQNPYFRQASLQWKKPFVSSHLKSTMEYHVMYFSWPQDYRYFRVKSMEIQISAHKEDKFILAEFWFDLEEKK